MNERIAPYACAMLNAAAAITLAALSPGTLAQADARVRDEFIEAHLLAWRAGWSVWMGASCSLFLLMVWWERRTRRGSGLADARHDRRTSRGDAQTGAGDPTKGGGRHGAPRATTPLVIAAIGLGCDLVGESLQIVAVPGAPALMPVAVLLTAGIANGLYTAAGAILTLRTRPNRLRAAWTWAVWIAGAGVSVTAFAGSVNGLVVTSAVLFGLFCPWCLALERWLRE